MKLIKLITPEEIELFFAGEESVDVNESCKIVSATDRLISETGAIATLVDGTVGFIAKEELTTDSEDFSGETKEEKKARKKAEKAERLAEKK